MGKVLQNGNIYLGSKMSIKPWLTGTGCYSKDHESASNYSPCEMGSALGRTGTPRCSLPFLSRDPAVLEILNRAPVRSNPLDHLPVKGHKAWLWGVQHTMLCSLVFFEAKNPKQGADCTVIAPACKSMGPLTSFETGPATPASVR